MILRECGFTERALAKFELLADAEALPDVRHRYRVVARHYRDLAEREEQADKARMAERIARLTLQRQQSAAQSTSSADRDSKFFLIAAE